MARFSSVCIAGETKCSPRSGRLWAVGGRPILVVVAVTLRAKAAQPQDGDDAIRRQVFGSRAAPLHSSAAFFFFFRGTNTFAVVLQFNHNMGGG